MKAIQNPVVVTGATGSIGSQIVRHLLRSGYPVILACRSEAKASALTQQLYGEFPEAQLSFMPINLSDEKAVRNAVASLPANTQLGGLINNAGVMHRSFNLYPCGEGREDTLNVNYFNTVLFTELLLPKMSKQASVVFTTSLTRFMGSMHNLPQTVTRNSFGQLSTYALSKKLITRYAANLAKRLAATAITVNCADPGVVNTEMIHMSRWFDPLADVLLRPFLRSPSRGAIPALRAFTSKQTGQIFTLRRIHPLKPYSDNR
ncbi:MAG: SDR family NAD(P)-dependent oxidoreductase [Muribaculum sp.]|nr:SDR family NAD(P)-dependent oxidoreductase [Muribaculaceae bacterium]MCM1080320.1 SDR family NAD(P)-dependent oxidoreductase [Muribaculum sp.]